MDHPTDDPRADDHPHSGRHHPLRDLVVDAAIEAELETGRPEETIEQARQGATRRLGRLVLGWILVLVGIAGLPLPGPGWLIIILGLSMLPYVWAERTIRLIRQRIPGVPEDGQIPTRTWAIMGVLVAASLGASVWWGLRDDSSAEERATAEVRSPVIGHAGAGAPQLERIYGSVIEEATDQSISYASFPEPANPLSGIEDGSIDGAIIPVAQIVVAMGAADESDARGRLEARKLKAFGPVVFDGVEFWPVLDATEFAEDDEELEGAIDGVSGLITNGGDVTGNPRTAARAMLADLGLTK